MDKEIKKRLKIEEKICLRELFAGMLICVISYMVLYTAQLLWQITFTAQPLFWLFTLSFGRLRTFVNIKTIRNDYDASYGRSQAEDIYFSINEKGRWRHIKLDLAVSFGFTLMVVSYFSFHSIYLTAFSGILSFANFFVVIAIETFYETKYPIDFEAEVIEQIVSEEPV